MQFLITNGLGTPGNGSQNSTLVASGLGVTGPAVSPRCLALQVLAVESFQSFVLLSFSKNLVTDGPGLDASSYKITGAGGRVRVLSVEQSAPHQLKLFTSRQQDGVTYTISLAEVGIVGEDGNVLNAPYTVTFVGVGADPITVSMIKSRDERTLDVIFAYPPLEADAILPANYAISPPVAVVSGTRITDFHYRLVTGPQEINANYTVTISNIRDSDGVL